MSEVFYNAKNLIVSNGFLRNPDRYYLEEFFERRPGLNANIQNATESTRMIANNNFEILGTNSSDDDVIFSTTEAGIQLQTDASDKSELIILPHLDTNQTAWTGILWGTDNQLEWQCAIRTGPSIANMSFFSGFKQSISGDYKGLYTTDNNQAYFLYSSDINNGVLKNYGNLYFIYSVNGTDYITDLGIAVSVSTIYKLRIVIDNNRQIAVFVNGVQYGLITSNSSGGTTQSNSTTLSNALKTGESLIPYVGVETHEGVAKQITLCYEKISRVLYQ